MIDRLVVGGPTKHVISVATGIAEQFDSVLISGSPANGECDVTYCAREAGIEPLVIPDMSREIRITDLKVLITLIGLFFRFRPDIVETRKSKAGALGRTAALVYKWATPRALILRPRRVAVIHIYHGHVLHSYFSRLKTALFKTIERVLARLCTDAIVVIGEQQRRELCKELRIGRPEQYRLIPLGIDFDEIPEAPKKLRRLCGVDSRSFLIGAVGRMCEVKNFGLIIRAMQEMVERHGGVRPHLALVGGGHVQPALQRLVEEVGMGENVTFTGFRDDALSLYCDMDVVALSSLNEGTPLTLIEGMGQGIPVVSTEVGGVIDLMGNRQVTMDGMTIWEHGVTVASGDTKAFARALMFMADHRELREQMGRVAREHIRASHSKQKLICDFEALYLELAGAPDVNGCTAAPLSCLQK